jgi:hypothetical protein
MAIDLLEPERPQVEGMVIDLLVSRAFRKAGYLELRDGQCRVRAPLTHELAECTVRVPLRYMERNRLRALRLNGHTRTGSRSSWNPRSADTIPACQPRGSWGCRSGSPRPATAR